MLDIPRKYEEYKQKCSAKDFKCNKEKQLLVWDIMTLWDNKSLRHKIRNLKILFLLNLDSYF